MNQINELFAELDAAPKVTREVVETEVTGEIRPFSALRLGNNKYQIANGAEGDSLVFRVDEDSDWVPLNSKMEEGWHKITAEILIATRDAMQDYALMHTIKMPLETDDPEHFSYNLFDFRWEMKVSPDENKLSLLLPERGWVEYDNIDIDSFESRRAASIHALVKATPDLVDNFREDVEAWAIRLASGSVVEPIL